ncbi:hypothetical protein M0802_010759 [Mischocyttarus mexicanus]|nr:hypothetical protein M0802_010759 [Mischocyttarus mexicanus]
MALGANTNTPEYIWGMETGKGNLEFETRRMAGDYLLRVLRMADERWPKICLREEIRGIVNGYQSEFGQRLKKVEDKEGIRWMFEGRELGAIRKKLEEWRARREEQGVQRCWGKKGRSSFCRRYKEWKIVLECKSYWNNWKWSGRMKEQWARLRCGSVGRSEQRGFQNTRCRLCGRGDETLEGCGGKKRR